MLFRTSIKQQNTQTYEIKPTFFQSANI